MTVVQKQGSCPNLPVVSWIWWREIYQIDAKSPFEVADELQIFVLPFIEKNIFLSHCHTKCILEAKASALYSCSLITSIVLLTLDNVWRKNWDQMKSGLSLKSLSLQDAWSKGDVQGKPVNTLDLKARWTRSRTGRAYAEMGVGR